MQLKNEILESLTKLQEENGKLRALVALVKDVQCNFPLWWYDEGYNEMVDGLMGQGDLL